MESLLIWIAELIRSAGAALASALGAVFSFLDALLNPVLSPLLSLLNPVTTFLGDCVYAVLGLLPPWLSLTVVSVALGVATLPVFRYTSNQKAIRKAKDDIKANLLALKLYKDDLRVTMRTQARLFWAILRLQRYILTPVAVMLLPMMLILAQVAARHQWRPLRPGERTVIHIDWQDPARPPPGPMALQSSTGVEVELGPLPGPADAVFRLRAVAEGDYQLQFTCGERGCEHAKEVIVAEGLERVSPLRSAKDWTSQLLHPIEPSLPTDGPVRAIRVDYPTREGWFSGTDSWVISLFVISILAAFLFRPLFRVTF